MESCILQKLNKPVPVGDDLMIARQFTGGKDKLQCESPLGDD